MVDEGGTGVGGGRMTLHWSPCVGGGLVEEESGVVQGALTGGDRARQLRVVVRLSVGVQWERVGC